MQELLIMAILLIMYKMAMSEDHCCELISFEPWGTGGNNY
jgi:hypothetical protein